MWVFAWLIAAVAATVSVFGAIAHDTLRAAVGAAVAALATGFAFYRRDYESTGYAAAMCAACAAILGAHSWDDAGGHPVAVRAAIGLAVLCVASLAFAFWSQRARGRWPDVLREKFGDKKVLEDEGVQFAATAAKHYALPGERIAIAVHVQNTVDAPREVTVDFVARNETVVLHRPDCRYTLKPGEVAVLHLECVLEHTNHALLELEIELHASGAWGRRGRRWRAEEYWAWTSARRKLMTSQPPEWARHTRLPFQSEIGRVPPAAPPSWRAETLWLPGSVDASKT